MTTMTFEQWFFGDLDDLLSEEEKVKQKVKPRYIELQNCWITAEKYAEQRLERKSKGGMSL